MKSTKMKISIAFFISVLLLTACTEEFHPKPKGYNSIELPDHSYRALPDSLPYTFEYSKHAVILDDSSSIAEENWIDIYYPAFKSNIQITYKALGGKKTGNLDELISDSYRLKSGHTKKATSIDEMILTTPGGLQATIFELEGEIPSQFQFFTTDSTKNFLRGAVYFRTAIHNDSLAPAIEYMKVDVLRILNTLKFKN
jgi:gliding motility-associated lipoprotein GldD